MLQGDFNNLSTGLWIKYNEKWYLIGFIDFNSTFGRHLAVDKIRGIPTTFSILPKV